VEDKSLSGPGTSPQPCKPKLTGKEYAKFKLTMTLHGFRRDFDADDGFTEFYSEEEREKHRIVADDSGRCVNLIGQRLDFGPLESQWEKGKEYKSSKFIWAMDCSGNLYIDLHDIKAAIYHSSMMGAHRPIAAGEICVVDGFIVMLNEDSGHYAPQGRLKLVVKILEGQGFKFPAVTLRQSAHESKVSRVEQSSVKNKVKGKLEALKADLKKEKVIK